MYLLWQILSIYNHNSFDTNLWSPKHENNGIIAGYIRIICIPILGIMGKILKMAHSKKDWVTVTHIFGLKHLFDANRVCNG